MSQQSRSNAQVDRARLASYLTVGVTGAMMATAHSEAAVVMIDLTNVQGNNITGPNGGPQSSANFSIYDWLGAGTGTLEIYNNYNSSGSNSYFGLDGDTGTGPSYLYFAITGGYATPRNFAFGNTIDSSANWSDSSDQTAFRYDASTAAPDFGAGSFMGFRFGTSGNYNYGYLEVTWNSSTNVFQLISGAYETTVNTSILAGATPSAVPGGGVSAMALMALGGGAFRRRSRGRVA
jgi:hypothetical protein